jgi:hypothetical protein
MESRRTKKMLWIHPFMNKRRGFNFLFYDWVPPGWKIPKL